MILIPPNWQRMILISQCAQDTQLTSLANVLFYMLSEDTKQPVKVDFYIAKEEGSVLLSRETVFQLQLLNVKPR